MYDLIIIGGGPAGLTAGIYAKRARLNTLLVEKGALGGQIAVTDVIENYPGFPSISGWELMERFEKHAAHFGLEIRQAEVFAIEEMVEYKLLKISDGDLSARAVIVATGAKPKYIGVPGEKEFIGKGVSYCATCDGPFFKGQDVLIVGGGDTAIKEAVYLSKIASRVYITHRRDQLRAEKIIQEKVFSIPNIEILWSTVITEIKGINGVEKVVLENLKGDSIRELDVTGVFIFIGVNPNTDFVNIDKDKNGYIMTNQSMETSVKGIFAAGDCRNTPLRQVSTAVGDGATAAFMAEKYIEEMQQGNIHGI
ncbi:MAG: thioredoxin-disulfide reductase [Deltaproteobacteria bacterium GWC2_42_11]|nr:MAG: thioredoxin-disulfide reductase [Deltaproteobacteria bacterium GWC2_42_11]